MEQIQKLNKGELLTIDPCYIKAGADKLERLATFHQGDGNYLIQYFINGEWTSQDEVIGADSGEIAIFVAKEDCEIVETSGLSGLLTTTLKGLPYDRITEVWSRQPTMRAVILDSEEF